MIDVELESAGRPRGDYEKRKEWEETAAFTQPPDGIRCNSTTKLLK